MVFHIKNLLKTLKRRLTPRNITEGMQIRTRMTINSSGGPLKSKAFGTGAYRASGTSLAINILSFIPLIH